MFRALTVPLFVISLAAFGCGNSSPSRNADGSTGNPDGGADTNSGDGPGSTSSITVDVTLHTGMIQGSTSYAMWPIAKFPVDASATGYSVRFFGFSGTGAASAPEGKVYSWDAGELPPTPYSVYPDTLDILDGQYHVAFSRTWCSGCTGPGADWEKNYRDRWGYPQAEVTYRH